MRHGLHVRFWKDLGIYTLTLLAASALLWPIGGRFLVVVAALTSLSAVAVVALAAEPRRLLRAMWRRRQGALVLTDDIDLNRRLDGYRRASLGSIEIDLTSGQLRLGGASTALGQGGRLRVVPSLLGARPGSPLQRWTLTLSDEGGKRLEHEAEVHPERVATMLWVLWRVCRQQGWRLEAPSGSVRAEVLQGTALERVQRQLDFLRGGAGVPDLDDRPDTLAGRAPLCERDSPEQVLYTFPRPVDHDEMRQQDHRIRMLALVCLLGVVTAPLAIILWFIRAEVGVESPSSLRLSPGRISIDGGKEEPLEDFEHVTAFPISNGPPLLMTRARALVIGGLTSYEDRVAWGRHLLERLARAMGDARFTHLAPVPLAPWTPQRLTLPPEPSEGEGSGLFGFFFKAVVSLVAAGALWKGFVAAIEAQRSVWVLAQRGAGLSLEQLQPDGWVAAGFGLGIFFLVIPWLKARPERRRAVVTLMGLPWVLLAMTVAGAQDLRRADARLPSMVLDGISLDELPLSDARLQGARLDGASMRGTDLRRADLTWSTLREADLTGANADEAAMAQARMHRVRADGASLQRAVLYDIEATEASLKGASFKGSDLRRANLTAADLSGANLEKTDLREANLQSAHLAGAHLQGANLCGAFMAGVDLSHADLRDALLTGASLPGATLTRARFSPTTRCPDGALNGERPSCGLTTPATP